MIYRTGEQRGCVLIGLNQQVFKTNAGLGGTRNYLSGCISENQ